MPEPIEMFATIVESTVPLPEHPPHFLAEVAKRKVNIAGWEPCRFEVVGDDL